MKYAFTFLFVLALLARLQAQIITTVAGDGQFGYSGDGAAATAAQLNSPSGVAVDGQGNLFIADYANHRIRRVVLSTGVISTMAGNGSQGSSGDGGALRMPS